MSLYLGYAVMSGIGLGAKPDGSHVADVAGQTQQDEEIDLERVGQTVSDNWVGGDIDSVRRNRLPGDHDRPGGQHDRRR